VLSLQMDKILELVEDDATFLNLTEM
jgi:hypothetical protein